MRDEMTKNGPDKNCVTLGDGSCIGKNCMHDSLVFPDDDLKRLEEMLRYNSTTRSDEIGANHTSLVRDEWEALLARLEAAENAREHHAPLCVCDWCVTWRKSAGKEG